VLGPVRCPGPRTTPTLWNARPCTENRCRAAIARSGSSGSSYLGPTLRLAFVSAVPTDAPPHAPAPAGPRTSDPHSASRSSALGVLGCLTGLLQAGLLALHRTG